MTEKEEKELKAHANRVRRRLGKGAATLFKRKVKFCDRKKERERRKCRENVYKEFE